MNFNLRERTIFLVLSGSRAYGTNTPNSDWDYKGIAIPPLDSYIGLINKFEQAVDSENSKHVYKHFEKLVQTEADMQVMELSKFVSLAAQCNPSVIEILFTDPEDYIIKHPIMDRLVENRGLFISKAAKARFCGYAFSQLQRMRRHKHWLDSPLTHKPTREEYGLPERGLISRDQIGAAEALIQKELDEYMIEQTHLPEDIKIELSYNIGRMMRAIWISIHPDQEYPVGDDKQFESTEDALYWGVAKDQGFSDSFLEVLNREKKYRSALREWNSYQHWLKHRNPKRAAIEDKFKFDLKNACHLVRLIRMSREILETGKVIVKRPDAEELRGILNGAWSYEKVVEFAESENKELDELVKRSTLPKVPDIKKIHQLTYEMIMEFNNAS